VAKYRARFYRRAASHPAGALDKVKTRGNAENGGGINGPEKPGIHSA
jgi:hypothetical protein